MENIKITSIEELIEASKGDIVELPPFSEGKRFFARLKRPSMMGIIKAGKIPNSLLVTANSLFESGVKQAIDVVSDDESISSLFDVVEVICEESFVEPKYSEIKNAGVTLTDEQMIFIFNYCQNGIEALSSFRSER